MNKYDKTSCHCNDNDIMLVNRIQASRLVTLLIGCFFGIFMTGYFFGKRKAMEQINTNLQQDLLANQCNMILPEILNPKPSLTQKDNGADIIVPTIAQSQPEKENEETIPMESSQYYQAKLIGFGTQKAAQQFVDRLQKRGITTTIVKRISKNIQRLGNNRTIQWYQVVTKPIASKDQLEKLVDHIKTVEKIHDVQMVKVENDINERKNTQKQAL
ncbi:MAG: hypothetical protein WDZ41_04800 [Candidatus Babeliales bacterium]